MCCLRLSLAAMLQDVRLNLAKEEVADAAQGCISPHSVTLAAFITTGLDLEEQQYVMYHSISLMPLTRLGVTFNLRFCFSKKLRQARNRPILKKSARISATAFSSGAKLNLHIPLASLPSLRPSLHPPLHLPTLPILMSCSLRSPPSLSLFTSPRPSHNTSGHCPSWLLPWRRNIDFAWLKPTMHSQKSDTNVELSRGCGNLRGSTLTALGTRLPHVCELYTTGSTFGLSAVLHVTAQHVMLFSPLIQMGVGNHV